MLLISQPVGVLAKHRSGGREREAAPKCQGLSWRVAVNRGNQTLYRRGSEAEDRRAAGRSLSVARGA
jgi:hypothetical protein